MCIIVGEGRVIPESKRRDPGLPKQLYFAQFLGEVIIKAAGCSYESRPAQEKTRYCGYFGGEEGLQLILWFFLSPHLPKRRLVRQLCRCRCVETLFN